MIHTTPHAQSNGVVRSSAIQAYGGSLTLPISIKPKRCQLPNGGNAVLYVPKRLHVARGLVLREVKDLRHLWVGFRYFVLKMEKRMEKRMEHVVQTGVLRV